MENFNGWKIKAFLLISAISLFAALVFLFIPKTPAAPAKMKVDLKTVLALPALRGPFRVGRTTAYLLNKDQPALPNQAAPREFVITVFYPAIPKADAAPGPYAEEALKTAYSSHSLTSDSAGALDHIQAHSYWNAPADRAAGKYPVLLFSPGGGEQPLFYTSLLEEISSHGYVIVSVPEPFDTPVIPLPDGRVLTSAQMDEWCKQNSLCQKAMNGDQSAAQKIMDAAKDNRAKDMSFTLDELEKINHENPILAGMLNLNKVGAFGHSFGGASSVRIAQLDRRVSAVAVLDSNIFTVIPEDSTPLNKPVMFMTAANFDVDAQGLAEIKKMDDSTKAYFIKSSPYYFLNIAGTTHQSFQPDAMFMAPYITIDGKGVTLNSSGTTPARITEIIAAYNIAFFDQYLKGQQQPLLAGPSTAYPEITFTAGQ